MKTRQFSPCARRARGFTLLEMLVVLVIIGMLVSMVGPRLFTKVDAAKADIISGKIVVHDYMSNNSCNR